jgi:hypothetical protein
MRSSRIRRAGALQVAALACVALALPLASQAADRKIEPGAPIVGTGSVHAAAGAYVLNGSVDPRTLATTYYFEYGPNDSYGKQTQSGTLPGGTAATSAVKVSETAPGFLPGYYYRLVAENGLGKKPGRNRIYTVKTVKKKDAFVLPKSFPAIPLGSTFALSGTLTGTGSANRVVVLQSTPYPYRTAYTDVSGPILTSATGAFSFRVSDLRTNTKFRVATVGGVPLYSLVVPQQVAVLVVLKVRASSHKGFVRLYGTVTPAEAGAHVLFQLEKPAKTEKTEKTERPGRLEKPDRGGAEKPERTATFATKFRTTVEHATKTISRFSLIVNVADAGLYRAFVEVSPGPLASGHSESILLRAPAKSGKKKG